MSTQEQMTYKELVNSRFSQADQSQQKKNAVSVLTGFMEFCKKSEESFVQEELLEKFEEMTERFLLNCSSDSTRYTKKSLLKKWKQHFINHVKRKDVQIKNHNFKSFVLETLALLGKDPYWLYKQTKSKTVYNWFMNFAVESYPSLRSKDLVFLTSKALGLEESFLWDNFVSYPKTIMETFTPVKSEYQNRQIKVKNMDSYSITENEWNSDEMKIIRQEAEELLIFKTTNNLPDEIYRPVTEMWSKDSDGDCGSYKHLLRMLRSYLGYLKNIKKVPLGSLRLSHILDKESINGMMNFMEKRHGFLTTTTRSMLSDFRILAKYFIQYPERANTGTSKEETVTKCKEYLDYLTQKIKKNKFLTSRKPEEQIRPFLELDEPLAPFFEALSVLKKQYNFFKREQPYLLDFHETARDIVLLGLIIEKPVRVKNLSKMKFDKNLYKRRDGLYELYLINEDVKNKREIKKTLSAELSRWIDIYRSEHYLKINPKAKDYVFISNIDIKYSEPCLSKVIGRLCERLIGIETRAHSFRHLRASAYLMKHPKDYLFVAEMLNDDLKTVIRKYAHINGRISSVHDDQHLDGLMKKYG